MGAVSAANHLGQELGEVNYWFLRDTRAPWLSILVVRIIVTYLILWFIVFILSRLKWK